MGIIMHGLRWPVVVLHELDSSGSITDTGILSCRPQLQYLVGPPFCLAISVHPELLALMRE